MSFSKAVNFLLAYVGLIIVRRARSEVAHHTDDRADDKRNELLQQELIRHQIYNKWSLVDHMSRLADDPKRICTCPLCDFQGTIVKFGQLTSNCIFGGGVLLRFKCPECDLIFGSEKMLSLNPSELSNDYEWHYQVYAEGDSTDQEVRAFHLLKPSKSGTYLNFGAGAWSKSVQVLRSEGWNVMAYEPHGSAQANADFVISSREELGKIKFDGVFSNNVLEHLRYPVEDLVFMRNLLKAGGRMSHATPCFEYLYEFTRFHLFFYLGRSREILAKKANLSLVDFVLDEEFMCVLYESDFK